MSKYSSKEEEFTAYLLSNPEIFKILYYCVVMAGKSASDLVQSDPIMNHLTFLPFKMKDVTRSTKPFFCNYKDVRIEYDWHDLTITGGSAITALEILTQKDTENYLHVHTTDIDIVWWPRSLKGDALLPIIAQKAPVYPSVSEDGKTVISNNYESFLSQSYITDIRKQTDYGITSLSPAIIHLTQTLAKELEKTLSTYIIADMSYIKTIYTLCSQYYSINPETFVVNFSVEASCDTKVSSSDSKNTTLQKVKSIKGSILSGSWNVVVYMEFPTIPLRLKIIDIAIHDECSSQKSDMLIYNKEDPIYSSLSIPESILVAEVPRSKFSITIPRIQRLLEQQYFALQNRIRDYWESGKGDVQKILTHHRRIQYIIDLLTEALFSSKNAYSDFLIKILQLKSFPLEYYTNVLQNIIPKKDEWIASCPIHFPPISPCSESVTDPTQVKLCALQTCKIPVTKDSQFFTLCEENKVLQKELCSVPKTSAKQTRKNSKRNSKKLG